MIKNKKFLVDEIMRESRHQFIYGYNGKEREEFLKETVGAYPITVDLSNPIGIYICDKGLPELPQKREKYDEILVASYNRRYLDYLTKCGHSIQQKRILADRSKKFFERVNTLFVSREGEEVTNLVELFGMLKEGKELCYDKYIEYINEENINKSYYEPPIEITMMEHFIEYFKRMINITSYLCIIFDQQYLLSRDTQKKINNYVGIRIW